MRGRTLLLRAWAGIMIRIIPIRIAGARRLVRRIVNWIPGKLRKERVHGSLPLTVSACLLVETYTALCHVPKQYTWSTAWPRAV